MLAGTDAGTEQDPEAATGHWRQDEESEGLIAMEMMNRAIEDASDFMEMKRRLMQRSEIAMRDDTFERALAGAAQKVQPPKRHGENRAQYRARVFGTV